MSKYNDKFLEHEQSLSSHPHPGHQSEVVYEHANSDAACPVLCPVDSGNEHYQHGPQGQAQLDVEFGRIFCS